MIDGMVVIDAVIHPWNLSTGNQNPASFAGMTAAFLSPISASLNRSC
ncbi:MAG: hypothetical protein ACT4QA_11610 [Panacagrimonas sp.]